MLPPPTERCLGTMSSSPSFLPQVEVPSHVPTLTPLSLVSLSGKRGQARVEEVVQKYSNFVGVPIKLDGEVWLPPASAPPPRLTGTKGSSNLHPGVVDDGAAGSSPLLFMSLDASYVDSVVVVAVAGTAVVELARRANSLRRVGSSEAPDEVVASALCRRMKHDGVIFGVLAAAPLLFLLARKGGSGAATTSLENPSSILRCSRKSLQDESSLRVDWRANNSCVW